MAEPTTRFTGNTQWFISEYGYLAKDYSRLYNVSPYAVVGAIANEYDTRFNSDLYFTMRGFFAQKVGDAFSLQWDGQPFSHAELITSYNDFNSGLNLSKWTNPVAVDVGPGNFKVATAIEIIRAYSKEHKGTGRDPLGLLKYSDSYDKLVLDLVSFKDPTTSFALTAAYIKQGESFFISKDPAAWNRLSSDEKDALLVMSYKLGPETLGKNIDARIASAQQNGEQFDFNPHGDGGQQHLNNADIIKKYYEWSHPSDSPCFPAGTLVLLSDGTEKPIEDIRPGDRVLAFDGDADAGRGALQPREVVRLFGGVTQDWIRIDFPDASGLDPLTLTPNHRVLTRPGSFVEAERLIEADGSVGRSHQNRRTTRYGQTAATRTHGADYARQDHLSGKSIGPLDSPWHQCRVSRWRGDWDHRTFRKRKNHAGAHHHGRLETHFRLCAAGWC